MSLKQQQYLKQQQRLTPMQMQVVKLTELSTLEFEEKVKQELEENMALEEGSEVHDDDYVLDNENVEKNDEANITQEDIALGDYINEEEVPDYYLPSSSSSSSENFADIPMSADSSLQEYLLGQLSELKLEEEDKEIAKYIIGSIDPNGYLERSLESIADDMLFQLNIEIPIDKLREILKLVQAMEPPGVAARSLKETLMLQLEKKDQLPYTHISMRVVDEFFDEFSKKHYDKILKQLQLSQENLKDVINEITSLNPKPGSNWNDIMRENLNTITPDFIVESQNGEVFFYLNSRNVPPLKVNHEYSELLKGYAQNKEAGGDLKSTVQFVKQKLDAAKWFIDAVRQRQTTMERTMETIIKLQRDFFLSGEESDLKPMILKDVADATGYDISTISRVTQNKYVQTHIKVYPLKYFFSESMSTASGEEISSREIKQILSECIENENKKKPLSDEKLTEILNEKGYVIARRTVAKYREQLRLPVARLRREM